MKFIIILSCVIGSFLLGVVGAHANEQAAEPSVVLFLVP